MSAQSKLQELLAKRRASNGQPAVQPASKTPTPAKVTEARTTNTGDTGTPSNKPTVRTENGTAIPVRTQETPESKPVSVAANSTHPLALKLAELEEAQDKKLPNRPYILKEIHDSLANDFELVTQLTEEEIGLIVSNLREHTGVTITPKPKKAQRKRSQPVDLSMLD